MDRTRDDLTTNPSLLLRLRDSHDCLAWALFVETYGPMVFHYCRRRNLQDCDAADVTQEVLSRVSKALPSFDYHRERGRFRDWLGTVTHRELLQFWRRKSRLDHSDQHGSEQVEQIADTQGWESHFHAELLQKALQRVQSEFSEQVWNAFERLWIRDEAASLVALEMKVSVGNLYVMKSRVLKRLKEEVLMLCDDLPLFEGASNRTSATNIVH